jgi:kynurenine formamidase
MSRRIVDLSVALEAGIKSDPPGLLPQIDYMDHQDGFHSFARLWPGLQREHMPDGEGPAAETCSITTHNGTHLDAPYHFASTQDHALPSGPRPALRIDEIDLDWCFQPGVKLDFRHLPDGYVAQPHDIETELARIGHTLKPLEIVLVNTRAGERYGEDDYLLAGCGLRDRARSDPLFTRTGDPAHRHRWLELGSLT